MTTHIISIYSEATAQEAAQLMKEKRIGTLLIKGYEGYVGIVSERDLVYKVVGEGLAPKINHLAITENGDIVGILSIKDLVQTNEKQST